jgi:hypothetical protein
MKRGARTLLGALGALLLLATASSADEHGLGAAARLEIEVAWLEGNLEFMASYEHRAESSQDLLCFAIRDLYWRPDPAKAADLRARYEAMEGVDPDGLLARRWAWLLGERRDSPWPVAAEPATDPWPALSLLIQDRERREQQGHVGYPGHDPISRHVTQHAGGGEVRGDLRLEWLSYAGDEFGRVYGDLPETSEEVHARAKAVSLRGRNQLIAIIGLLALVILTLAYAQRIRL